MEPEHRHGGGDDGGSRRLWRRNGIPLPSLDRLRGLAWLAGRIARADSGVVVPLVVTDPSERGTRETADATFEVAGSIDNWIGTGCRPGDLVVMSVRFPWERTLRDAQKIALERDVSLVLTATPDGAGAQVVRGLRAASGV